MVPQMCRISLLPGLLKSVCSSPRLRLFTPHRSSVLTIYAPSHQSTPSGSPPPAEASVPIATPVPIKLFEVSDVVLRDDTRDTHTRCSAHHRPPALFGTHSGNGDEDGECGMS